MWVLKNDFLNVRQVKRYGKKHPDELDTCLARIRYIQQRLNDGIAFQLVAPGIIRNEGSGLFAVGSVRTPSSRESRFYFYVYFGKEHIYLLGIGDKDSQRRDIAAHRKTISHIRNAE